MRPALSSAFLIVMLAGLIGFLSASRADSQVIVWGNFDYSSPNLTNISPSATNVIEMAAGDAHCVALKSDGTVVAWGGNENNAGATNVPSGLSNVVSIAAGSTHSLALRSDGTLAAWGQFYASSVNVTVPPAATNIVALALGAGATHALVLKGDGTVLDWGNNNYGYTNIPLMARDIVAVASGSFSGLALRSDGKVVTWGVGITVPASATNIVAIATSWMGNAALRSDGTVLTWGQIKSLPPTHQTFTNFVDLVCPFNSNGSSDIIGLRGNGTLLEAVNGLPNYPTNNITAIAAGSYNAFAIVGNGTPVFPGLPINRTVAAGSSAYFRAVAAGTMPISYQWLCNGTNVIGATNTVLALTNVQPVLAGNYYSLMASNSLGTTTNGAMTLNVTPSEAYIQVTASSAVVNQNVTFTASTIGQGPFTYQWQLNGTNLLSATNLVLTLTNAQLSDAGSYSIIVSNSFGVVTNNVSLAVSPTIITNLPQNQIAFLGGTTTFSLGLQTIIPVTYQWQFNGFNLDGATNSSLTLTNANYGQDGTYTLIFSDFYETVTNNASLAVVPVAAWGDMGQQSLPGNLTNVIALAAGESHGLALKADGTLMGWGNNSYGEATAPPGVSNIIAIAAGSDDSLALASNGCVLAWGNNSYGQTNVPAGLTNVVAIAAGDLHSLALKSDGTVVAWGYDGYGQTNVPAGLTNVVAIAAGEYNSLALCADGTVFAWGSISNMPQNVTNVIQMAGGGVDYLVLKADGSLAGWGANYSGEDNIPSGLSNVVAIAAGIEHSAALKADGTVIAWGLNYYGETTTPIGLTNVTSLAAKGFHNIALIGNGPPTVHVSISNSTWTASGFQFSVPSQSGRVYALEYKDSLTDSNWSALPLAAGNGGMLTLTDPTASHSQRFYRVLQW